MVIYWVPLNRSGKCWGVQGTFPHYAHIRIKTRAARNLAMLPVHSCRFGGTPLLDDRDIVHPPVGRHLDNDPVLPVRMPHSPERDEGVARDVVAVGVGVGDACARSTREHLEKNHHPRTRQSASFETHCP